MNCHLSWWSLHVFFDPRNYALLGSFPLVRHPKANWSITRSKTKYSLKEYYEETIKVPHHCRHSATDADSELISCGEERV